MSGLSIIQSREHPHYGESGWLDDSGDDNEAKIEATGQVYFKLSHCAHGKIGCYVLPTEIASPDDKTVAVEGEVVQPNLGGRPLDYGPPMVDLLSRCFEEGMNITEACHTAGISRETYYNWLEKHEGFSDRMNFAKGALGRLAKNVVRQALKAQDPNTARWYLDRRDPDFKSKGEVELLPGQQRTEEKLKEFMDDTNDGAYPGLEPDASSVESPAEVEPTVGNEVAPSPPDIS